MRILLLLCALASPAQAAVFAHAITNDGKTLNLHDTKCKGAVPSWDVELVTSASIVFKGCWMHHPAIEGAVLIKWDDGDESVAPKSAFKMGARGGI